MHQAQFAIYKILSLQRQMHHQKQMSKIYTIQGYLEVTLPNTYKSKSKGRLTSRLMRNSRMCQSILLYQHNKGKRILSLNIQVQEQARYRRPTLCFLKHPKDYN